MYRNRNCKDLLVLLFLIMIIPTIPVEGLYYLARPFYDLLYRLLILGILVFNVLFFFIRVAIRKRISIGKATLAFILFAGVNIFLTIFFHGDFMGVFGVWVYTLTLLLVFENYKKYATTLPHILLRYLEALLIVNALLIIAFPHGMYRGDVTQYGQMWLLGYKSSLQCYVLPAVFLSLIESHYLKETKHFVIILILSHFESFMEKNAMLLVILVLLDITLYMRLFEKDIVNRKNVFLGVLIVLFANIFIVFFTEKLFSISFVQYVLVDLLGKNSTLSLRTSNWKSVWGAIRQSPFIGYGYTSDLTRSILYGRETAHAHNMVLEMLYEGGLLQVVLFIFFNCIFFKELLKSRNTIVSRIIFVFLALFYVMYIFENPLQKTNGAIWLLFIIAFYSRQIDYALRGGWMSIFEIERKPRRVMKFV